VTKKKFMIPSMLLSSSSNNISKNEKFWQQMICMISNKVVFFDEKIYVLILQPRLANKSQANTQV